MKVAYIVPSLRNMGPTIVINTLVKHLFNWGIDLTVYYFDDSESLMFPCPVCRIEKEQPFDFDKYDIIHSNMYRPDKYIYRWKHQIHKAKLVTTIHQDIFTNLRYNYNILISCIFTPVWKKYINSFHGKVYISKSLESIDKAQNSIVIPNGVDIELDSRNLNEMYVDKILKFKKDGFKIIGTYASINKGKGIDQLLSLAEMRHDIGVVIIGEGKEKKKLERYVIKVGINNRVLFLPYLKDPYNYLEYVDVYVMPSRNEGFGLSMIEAAMTGTPIICSDIPVFHEIFNENQVEFFKLENIKSMSVALDKILSNHKYYSTTIKNHVFGNFTGEIMAQRYLNYYKELLQNKEI